MPHFNLIFSWVGLALGWGVRRFHTNIHMFSNPTSFGKSHTLMVGLTRKKMFGCDRSSILVGVGSACLVGPAGGYSNYIRSIQVQLDGSGMGGTTSAWDQGAKWEQMCVCVCWPMRQAEKSVVAQSKGFVEEVVVKGKSSTRYPRLGLATSGRKSAHIRLISSPYFII